MFLPEEIEAISLSARTDFSPYLGRGRDEVEPRGNHVDNYLDFRGFKNEVAGEYTKRDSNSIILVPLHDRGLWAYDWQKNRLVKGFFILYDRIDSQKSTMYEVNNQPMDTPYEERDIGAMVGRILSSESQLSRRSRFSFGKPQGDFSTYTGNGIVAKLAQIPVAERHF